jgi:hypothetical protein
MTKEEQVKLMKGSFIKAEGLLAPGYYCNPIGYDVGKTPCKECGNHIYQFWWFGQDYCQSCLIKSA